ncbi:uncharacterized protein [Mobula birostris]|uniref:uncharacterized protein n=1 Tax=Mobula birostris TaxID=1983395 RepID=UPI003B28D104
MEFEAVDSCIQRSLSALYPPFEETAATLLGQVFDVLEKTYQNDALRYIIDFFIPAKHILQTIQQQACEPYASRRFTHAGWPLCQRGLVLVQLSALDWRQLQPGDFYLQLAPPPLSPLSSPLGRGARLLLKWPGAEGPVSEPVDEASYPHLFTAEWLDGVNRRLARGDSGHRLLEWCLAAEGGRLQRLPWRRVIYPQLEPEGGPGREPGPRPPAVGTRRRPSGDGADAEPRAEAALKRGLGNGQESGGDNGAPDGEVYCSGAGSDDPEGGDEGEYVELSEASPQRGPAFPRWRRACTGPAAVATTLPAPGGRRRRSGAQGRRGAWLHRRQRRQPDSSSGSKWKSGGKAPARCRSSPVDGGRARRHRPPEEGPDGEEWVRRLAQVELAGGKEGPLLGATGLADLAWRESLALEGAGDLSKSSNQMAGTQSEVGPKPGYEGTGLVEASMHSLAEMDISLCRAEWRLVEVCESEVGAESSLGARGASGAGIELSGLASTQTVVDQSSVCHSSSLTGSQRSLAEGNSPKSVAKQHALTFGNDPSLDQKQTGSELPLEEKVLPAAVTEIPLSPESTVQPGSKHSVSSARKSGLKTGTGQGTSPETQQSLAEEGLLTTGTERSLANPEVSADQHLSEQPTMETGSGQVTPERGSVQRAVVTGTECSLAARGQLSIRDQQPLAERVATNTGTEGPLAERVVPVIGIEQPLAGSRVDCSLGGREPSTAGSPVPLAGCNRSDSSPQGSQLEQWQPAGGSERRPLLAGQTQRPTAAPEGGDETLLDPQRGKARPTDAGKSPAPTAPGLASAWKRHEDEEDSGVEPALHNHRADQTACQEAREQGTHSEKVPQREQSNSSTEEGPCSVRPSGDKGGGKDSPRQAPSVPAYHKTGSMTLPLPSRAAQQLSKVSCPRWSEVSLPPAALSQSSEVSSPQLPEVSSSEPSKVSSSQPPESLTSSIKVPSPQLSEVPSSQLSKLSSPQLPEVALSQSSEVPSPQLPNAPSLQLPEVPSPLLPEVTSCQASEVPSPPLPQVPSPATGNVHSPQPPDAASCQTAEVSPQPLGGIPSPHLPEVLTPRPSEVSAHPLPQDPAPTGRENSDAAEESEPLGLDGDLAVDPCPAASLKVDLDVLRSEVLSLPGSRDRDGRALVIVAVRNPEPQDPRCSSAQLVGVLLYLHSISRKEMQERGLRVLMDARGSWPAAAIWKALDTFQQTVPGGIHSVLVLMGKERPTPKELPLGLQVEALPSLQALHERVEPAQLTTAPFGGSFRYSHQKWVRFRLSLESLVQACRTSIQFLRSTTFQLEAKQLPENEKTKSCGGAGPSRRPLDPSRALGARPLPNLSERPALCPATIKTMPLVMAIIALGEGHCVVRAESLFLFNEEAYGVFVFISRGIEFKRSLGSADLGLLAIPGSKFKLGVTAPLLL